MKQAVDKLLTTKQVAELLSISERTLWRLVSSGRLPKPIKLSARTVRWKHSDILAFIEAGGNLCRK